MEHTSQQIGIRKERLDEMKERAKKSEHQEEDQEEHEKLIEFLNAEIEEIKKYKWIKSEESHKDAGMETELEWIKLYAPLFRKNWEKTHGKIHRNYPSRCNIGS